MKLIISVILFMCLGFNNKAQTFDSLYNTSEVHSHNYSNGNIDKSYLKSYPNRVNENSNKKVNIFFGIGYTPFKLNTGIAYFISRNTEINIQYSNMFIPISLDIDVFSMGMRFYEDKSATIYSISGGLTKSRQNRTSLIGLCFEGSLGYLIPTDVGFYFLPSFKAGFIFRKQENLYGIIGIDLSIGWFIK